MITRQEFTPSWARKGKKDARPVYYLRPATVLDRDEFEAELSGRYRAGQVAPHQYRDIAIDGIRALVQGEDADKLVELVQSVHSARQDALAAGRMPDDAALSPAERAEMKAVEDILTKHWPDYQAAVEQEAKRNQVLPTLAFMRWCDGWKNVTGEDGKPVDYERDPLGEIPEDVLRRLPRIAMRAAGLEAYYLQYGRGEAKN